MKDRCHLLACLALAVSGTACSQVPTCLEQAAGRTAEGAPVTVCGKTFREAPLVRLPDDDRASPQQTILGVVEMDIRGDPAKPDVFHINAARLVDRHLVSYDLVGADGKPVDENHPVMKANLLPSNRVHYLVYEARGTIAASTFRLQSLRPVILVTGRAIDERFLGAWEGAFSLYDGNRAWSRDQAAKVRLEMKGLVPHFNIPTLAANMPPLADGTRYKALGGVMNAERGARLSTGECAPALRSLQQRNPLLEASDYVMTLWRFPAMHTMSSQDFHVVDDYPRDLYPATLGMATQHNFRLKDYIAVSTAPQELVFRIHGNPIGQMTMWLTPVQGGGGDC